MKLTKNMAVAIPVYGEPVKFTASPTLEEAQKLVQGYVEMRSFTHDGIAAQALFNEDGLLKKMQPNIVASELVGIMLVGPVVILTGSRRWS